MKNNKGMFTAGQFAELHDINKRTLHYYDDIGLFSPSYKGENGYRYYTYLQSPTLEIILTLRELNMSIEEITRYMTHRSALAFHKIITTKTAEIDDKIKRLKDIRELLAEKERLLTMCEESNLTEIEIVECHDEYLLLSGSITGAYDEDDFAVLVEHMQDLREHRQYNKSYGSMIAVEKIFTKSFDEYDCFFTKVNKVNVQSELFIKPKGKYIKAFCQGDWSQLPNVYLRIATFAREHGLTLKGYAYEYGINEMAISSMDEYITQIMIMCE